MTIMGLADIMILHLGDGITITVTNNQAPITVPRIGELIKRNDGVLRQIEQVVYEPQEPCGEKIDVYTKESTWNFT